MSVKQQILICDDQHIIHETLGVYLRNEGFESISAFDGEQAIEEFNRKKPNLVILDLMMPKKSGMDVCREIRQNSSVPIIMLTAKSEEIDRVLGLELGADDYIVKPFSAREVVARVKAVLRRYSMQETEPAKILHYGNLEININNYDVRLNGERRLLTPKGSRDPSAACLTSRERFFRAKRSFQSYGAMNTTAIRAPLTLRLSAFARSCSLRTIADGR